MSDPHHVYGIHRVSCRRLVAVVLAGLFIVTTGDSSALAQSIYPKLTEYPRSNQPQSSEDNPSNYTQLLFQQPRKHPPSPSLQQAETTRPFNGKPETMRVNLRYRIIDEVGLGSEYEGSINQRLITTKWLRRINVRGFINKGFNKSHWQAAEMDDECLSLPGQFEWELEFDYAAAPGECMKSTALLFVSAFDYTTDRRTLLPIDMEKVCYWMKLTIDAVHKKVAELKRSSRVTAPRSVMTLKTDIDYGNFIFHVSDINIRANSADSTPRPYLTGYINFQISAQWNAVLNRRYLRFPLDPRTTLLAEITGNSQPSPAYAKTAGFARSLVGHHMSGDFLWFDNVCYYMDGRMSISSVPVGASPCNPQILSTTVNLYYDRISLEPHAFLSGEVERDGVFHQATFTFLPQFLYRYNILSKLQISTNYPTSMRYDKEKVVTERPNRASFDSLRVIFKIEKIKQDWITVETDAFFPESTRSEMLLLLYSLEYVQSSIFVSVHAYGIAWRTGDSLASFLGQHNMTLVGPSPPIVHLEVH